MKKLIALLLTAGLTVSLCACAVAPAPAAPAQPAAEAEAEAPAEEAAEPAAPADQIVLTYGHVDPNTDGFQYTYAEDLKSRIEEATDGRVTLKIFPGETLGSSAEMTDMVKAGTLDMFSHTFATFAPFSEKIGVFNAPYVFNDVDQLVRASSNTSPVIQEVNEELLANAGVRLVGAYLNGTRVICSKIEAYKPEDFNGHKFRAIGNDLWIAMITGLGGVATPIESSEVVSSLMTGVVDATEQTVDGVYQNAYWEVSDYLLRTDHMLYQNCIIANENSWQKLTPEDQQIILDIFDQMAVDYAAKVADMEAFQFSEIEKAGMKIITKEDGLDVDAFRESVLKQIKETFPQWTELIDKIQSL
ncbi:MAG: TRAP transporter substrate-binding protein [Lachnospiraceae bacterium]|nr:TRAP transporter substrate-binding protein [Lachnospiraceae bacterium]